MAALGGNVGVVAGPGNSKQLLTRNLERVLEEASLSGDLKLSGRKLREFPKVATKFNLSDTVYADLSKNRLSELPAEVTQYASLEKLIVYHNVIRVIPDTIAFLQSLTYLDLSRNQLSVLPACLSQLALQVLIVSHNRLVSLPEELGRMKTLLELDATSNQLSHIPPQLGDLHLLRSLSLRKNCLVELPKELTFLRLTKLDIAENRISALPAELRFMTSLEEFCVDHNPLSSPPAYLCTRGRVHVFKYLEIQALKEDKKRGILDLESRRSQKKSLPLSEFRCPVSGDPRRKRFTVDSGYNTCDGADRRWSQDSHDTSNDSEEGRRLALRAAEMLKDTRIGNGFDTHHSPAHVNGHANGCVTPLQHNSAERARIDSEKTRSHQQQQQHGLTPEDEEEEEEGEREERRRAARKIIEQQKEESRKRSEAVLMRQAQEAEAERMNDDKRPVHMQTYREYKEALRQQRGDVYRPRTSGDNSPVLTPSQEHPLSRTSSLSPVAYSPFTGHPLTPTTTEPFVKAMQKEAVLSYVKSKTSPVVGQSPVRFHDQEAMWNANANANAKQSLATRVSNGSSTSSNGGSLSHAISPVNTGPGAGPRQRHLPQTPPGPSARESELLQQLRNSIESRLKVSLPDDLGSALLDGVVLCHLANHVQPRAVASIHVPSPAVPKLTLAKCRRNVENFLEACRRIGVPEDRVCSGADVLERRGLVRVAQTVTALLSFYRGRPSPAPPSLSAV